MKTSKALKEERAAKFAEQQQLVEAAKNEKGEARDFTPEEEKRFDTLQTEIDAFDPQIKRAEAFEANQRAAAAAAGNPVGGSEQREKDNIMKHYSLHKAIRQNLRSSNESLDGAELEMHQEITKRAKNAGVSLVGLAVPMTEKRATEQSVTGDAGAYGGNLVATQTGGLIEFLRPTPILESIGAKVIRGLTGNVEYPTNDGGIAASWEGEMDATPRTRNAYGKKSMAPNRLAAYTAVSLQNLIQSNIDLEAQTKMDIEAVIANAVDSAAINGAGTGNVPLGILNASGTYSVAAGTNGDVPTWAHIVGMETGVYIENAQAARMNYLINYVTKGKLKTTAHAANNAGYLMNGNNEINGYGVGVSNLVPSDLTKGTGTALSAGIFGDFSQLIIGQWGFMSLITDEVTLAEQGLVKITANSYWDVLVRQPKAFAVVKDWVTV